MCVCVSRLVSQVLTLKTLRSRLASAVAFLKSCLTKSVSLKDCLSKNVYVRVSLQTCLFAFASLHLSGIGCLSRNVSQDLSLKTFLSRSGPATLSSEECLPRLLHHLGPSHRCEHLGSAFLATLLRNSSVTGFQALQPSISARHFSKTPETHPQNTLNYNTLTIFLPDLPAIVMKYTLLHHRPLGRHCSDTPARCLLGRSCRAILCKSLQSKLRVRIDREAGRRTAGDTGRETSKTEQTDEKTRKKH